MYEYVQFYENNIIVDVRRQPLFYKKNMSSVKCDLMNKDAIILVLPKPGNSSEGLIIWNPQRTTAGEAAVFVYDNSKESMPGFGL